MKRLGMLGWPVLGALLSPLEGLQYLRFMDGGGRRKARAIWWEQGERERARRARQVALLAARGRDWTGRRRAEAAHVG